jgi:Tol biopolymer transport system component
LYPVFLPDGRRFLYTIHGGASPGIYVASLDNPEGQRLLADESSVPFAPARFGSRHGHLIFAREGKLMAQRFDPNTLDLAGETFVVAERALVTENGSAAVSVSDNSVLMYRSGRSRENDSRLVWFDRSGKTLASEGGAGPPSPTALSPDERTAAVLRRQAGLGIGDLWLRDLNRGLETRFTFDRTIVSYGNIVWSPDGNQIAFSAVSESVDLYRKDVHATGPAESIFKNRNRKVMTDWSRDGRYLLYTEIDPKTGADLWYLRVDGSAGATPVSFLQTEFDESYGQVSPDGGWMAYVSNETGDFEVYVRAFPSGAGKMKISATAGRHVGSSTTQPRWSHDGTELFYLTGPVGKFTLMAAPVKVGLRLAPGAVPMLQVGAGRPLFEVRANTYDPASSTFFYSVSKDGQRFLIDHVEAASEPALNVIVNWDQAVVRQ